MPALSFITPAFYSRCWRKDTPHQLLDEFAALYFLRKRFLSEIFTLFDMEESAAQQKLKKYWLMTEKALTLAKIAAEDKNSKEYKAAADFLLMAKNYLSDSKHFAKKGDALTAIAAVSYAHAWLDAGARLGLFKVDNSSNLFTVD